MLSVSPNANRADLVGAKHIAANPAQRVENILAGMTIDVARAY
jgi:hypothetical protein